MEGVAVERLGRGVQLCRGVIEQYVSAETPWPANSGARPNGKGSMSRNAASAVKASAVSACPKSKATNVCLSSKLFRHDDDDVGAGRHAIKKAPSCTADHAGKYTSLSQVKGSIARIAKDKDGSAFLQKRLETESSGHDADIIFVEVFPVLPDLMTDSLGTYVVQKLFVWITDRQKQLTINDIGAHLSTLAKNKFGSHAVQALIKQLETKHQKESLLGELAKCSVRELLVDPHGTHVVHAAVCLGDVDPQCKQFIFDALKGAVVTLAKHRLGTLLVQACLTHAAHTQKELLLGELLRNALELAHDVFGNYTVQQLVACCPGPATRALVTVLADRLASLACSKYACHIIDKLLECPDKISQGAVVRELLSSPAVAQHAMGKARYERAQEVAREHPDYLCTPRLFAPPHRHMLLPAAPLLPTHHHTPVSPSAPCAVPASPAALSHAPSIDCNTSGDVAAQQRPPSPCSASSTPPVSHPYHPKLASSHPSLSEQPHPSPSAASQSAASHASSAATHLDRPHAVALTDARPNDSAMPPCGGAASPHVLGALSASVTPSAVADATSLPSFEPLHSSSSTAPAASDLSYGCSVLSSSPPAVYVNTPPPWTSAPSFAAPPYHSSFDSLFAARHGSASSSEQAPAALRGEYELVMSPWASPPTSAGPPFRPLDTQQHATAVSSASSQAPSMLALHATCPNCSLAFSSDTSAHERAEHEEQCLTELLLGIQTCAPPSLHPHSPPPQPAPAPHQPLFASTAVPHCRPPLVASDAYRLGASGARWMPAMLPMQAPHRFHHMNPHPSPPPHTPHAAMHVPAHLVGTCLGGTSSASSVNSVES